MTSSGLEDYSTTKKIVDLIRRTIKQEINKERPAPAYCVVKSVDTANRRVFVQFPGETSTVSVAMSSPYAALVGQVVRVEGITGDRYVTDIVVAVGDDGEPVSIEPAVDWKFYNDDIFDISVDGAQAKMLTYKPNPQSLHVEVRGITARKYTEWSINGRNLSLLAPLNLRSGDVLYTEYVYDPTELTVVVPTDVWPLSSGAGIAQQPYLPVDAVAGECAILFIAHDQNNTITATNGWTILEQSSVTHLGYTQTYTYQLTALTKILAGSDAMPVVAFSNNNQNVFVCVSKPGGGSVSSSDSLVVADDITCGSPAAVGDFAVRGWMGISNRGAISTPIRETTIQTQISGGTDVDLAVIVETQLSSVSATCSETAGWVSHAVGVIS